MDLIAVWRMMKTEMMTMKKRMKMMMIWTMMMTNRMRMTIWKMRKNKIIRKVKRKEAQRKKRNLRNDDVFDL